MERTYSAAGESRTREEWQADGLWDQWQGAPRLDLLAPAPEHATPRPRPQRAAEEAEEAVLTGWADGNADVAAALKLARPIFSSLPTGEDRQDAEQDLLTDLWADGKLADAACVVTAARSLRADYWRTHYRHGATVALDAVVSESDGEALTIADTLADTLASVAHARARGHQRDAVPIADLIAALPGRIARIAPTIMAGDALTPADHTALCRYRQSLAAAA